MTGISLVMLLLLLSMRCYPDAMGNGTRTEETTDARVDSSEWSPSLCHHPAASWTATRI